MAGLTDNFLFDPLLRQSLLRAKCEDSHDKLFASVAVAPSELDVSSFGLVVVLFLVQSKGHSFRHGCKNAKCPDGGASSPSSAVTAVTQSAPASIVRSPVRFWPGEKFTRRGRLLEGLNTLPAQGIEVTWDNPDIVITQLDGSRNDAS